MRTVPLIVFVTALCIVALSTQPAAAGWQCGTLQRSPVETGMGTSCTAAQSDLINKLYSHVKCFNTCYERIIITRRATPIRTANTRSRAISSGSALTARPGRPAPSDPPF